MAFAASTRRFGSFGRQSLAVGMPVAGLHRQQEIFMSVLNIPTVIGNAISSLSSHHGHKKGVHGGGASNPLNSTTSSASASTGGQPTGSTQNLFGTLLDTVEQVVGIQTPTNTANAVNSLTTNALHAGTVTPASITAAQAALKRI